MLTSHVLIQHYEKYERRDESWRHFLKVVLKIFLRKKDNLILWLFQYISISSHSQEPWSRTICISISFMFILISFLPLQHCHNIRCTLLLRGVFLSEGCTTFLCHSREVLSISRWMQGVRNPKPVRSRNPAVHDTVTTAFESNVRTRALKLAKWWSLTLWHGNKKSLEVPGIRLFPKAEQKKI